VLLWRPNINETSPKEITTDIEGCQSNSTLEQFVERSKNYQMLPSPKDVKIFSKKIFLFFNFSSIVHNFYNP